MNFHVLDLLNKLVLCAHVVGQRFSSDPLDLRRVQVCAISLVNRLLVLLDRPFMCVELVRQVLVQISYFFVETRDLVQLLDKHLSRDLLLPHDLVDDALVRPHFLVDLEVLDPLFILHRKLVLHALPLCLIPAQVPLQIHGL